MKPQSYAVIMAGRRGTRFWPLSPPHRPNHLLKILSQKTLLREAVDRVLPLFGPKHTLVVTGEEHYRAVREELRILPKTNFIVEPQGNNTAPGIGLAAAELARREPDAIMTILPADHWVSNPNSFLRTVKSAVRLAREHDALVTIGMRPTYPETGYGYILKGGESKGTGGGAFYRGQGFKEKPNARMAGRR